MKKDDRKRIVIGTLFCIFFFTMEGTGWAASDIQSKKALNLEIIGYNCLEDTTLFLGELAAGIKMSVSTSYERLAPLLFEKGQAYPFILVKQPFLLQINSMDIRPSFIGSEENTYMLF